MPAGSTQYGERRLLGDQSPQLDARFGSTAVSRFADLSAGLQSLDFDRQTADIRENPVSANCGCSIAAKFMSAMTGIKL